MWIHCLWCVLHRLLGTLTVEEVFQDRDKFAKEVRNTAHPDVSRMGIEIVSFTIKDVSDRVEYLSSLGRAQTANVIRDADIGVAEASRDAGIRVSILDNCTVSWLLRHFVCWDDCVWQGYGFPFGALHLLYSLMIQVLWKYLPFSYGVSSPPWSRTVLLLSMLTLFMVPSSLQCCLLWSVKPVTLLITCLQEAEAEKTRMDTKYSADARIADSNREFKMMQAQFDQEVNTKVRCWRGTFVLL